MSKLDKEFKSEVDKEIREGSYVAGQIGKRALIVVLAFIVLGGIGGVGYTLTIGKWQKNVWHTPSRQRVSLPSPTRNITRRKAMPRRKPSWSTSFCGIRTLTRILLTIAHCVSFTSNV